MAVCEKFGVAANLDEVVSSCGTTEKGSTLVGLHSGAKAKGFEAAGMKIGVGELAALKCPAIAHLWNNHFVVVDGSMGDLIRVLDPPTQPVLMPKEDFAALYSGFALLVSKDRSLFPEPKPEGADIRLSEYAWDFGPVHQGSSLEYTISCRNEGSEDVVISKVDSSCACAAASISESRIAPGGQASLKVTFDSAGRWGEQHETVFVRTNDPITPVVQLQVLGVVRPSSLVHFPDSVNFGIVRKGASAAREVFVPGSQIQSLEVSAASCDTPYLQTAVAKSAERNGYVVSVALSRDTPIGELKSKITVETNHPKEPKVEIPVIATIKGEIDVFPDTIFFGVLKKGDSATRKLVISTAGAESFRIEAVNHPLSHLMVKATPEGDRNQYLLAATLLSDAPAGYIKDEIVLSTNNPRQPEIRVPVYALVEE